MAPPPTKPASDLPVVVVEPPPQENSLSPNASTSSVTSFDTYRIQAESTPTKKKRPSLASIFASPAKSFCSTASACRICHEGDTVGPLTSPCECKGTIALVHNCCLEKWLTTSNTSTCEVCQYNFKVSRTPRPPSQWLNNEESRILYLDLICLFVFVPVGVIVSCLGAQVAIAFLKLGRLEGLGLASITVMLAIFLFLWISFTIRYHWRNFVAWREANPEVHLISERLRNRTRSRQSNISFNP
ncbi:(Membrane-Associated Ring finger (C3HHypothetical protein)) [Nesidiocoris tenuis]|uniref:RING-CH-type domain-containing protein n=1 Tax=Nesidiocoris tenuis TaxID=355587 RepID=A0ABN7ADW5_9HEMI|nr:(Membrane-Associated Ring finger (C3HHypothetical protein)) [Nesidiocoris tenuis]